MSQTRRKCGALPPVGAGTPAAGDKEAEKLDSWFEGVSRPSRCLRDLARRKRRQHDAVLRELRRELFRERSDAQRTVHFVSSNLRAELDKASRMVKLKRQDVAELCARADVRDDPRALREAVSAAGDVVRQLTEQRQRAVDAFYDLLLDVEGEHQKRAAAALDRHAAALAHIGHLSPQRLQPLLDAERQEVGELHLQSVISFGDLRLCLNMQAERDCRRFKEAVGDARRRCGERCQRAALGALQEAGNRPIDDIIRSSSTGTERVRFFKIKQDELRHPLSWSKPYPFTEDDVKKWESNLNSCVQQIDDAVEKISVSLKDGLTQIKTFSTAEVVRLKQFVLESGICRCNTFDSLNQNACLPLLDHIEKRIIDEPSNFMVWWRQVLQDLASETHSFTSLIRNAGKLWDQHCKLRDSGRATTLQKLSNKKQDREKHVEAKERRIKLLTEKSRQETNKTNLEETVKRIFKILDEVKCSYTNMEKDETVILEDCASLVTHDLDSLRSSAELFLKEHEPSQLKTRITVDLTQMFDESKELISYIQLQRTRHYKNIEVALTQDCERFLQRDAEDWVQSQLIHLHMEHNEILEKHALRYDEIRTQVELARLEEIDENSRLVDLHREMNLDVSRKIGNALESTSVNELHTFREHSSYVSAMLQKGLQDNDVQSVKEIIRQIETHYAQCKDSVTSLNNQYQSMVQMEIEKMKKGNANFLSTLRQFSEGGTFTDSEVKHIKSEMFAMELEAESYGRENIMALRERSKDCCSEAMKHVKICIKDLQLHLDSLNFTGQIVILIGKSQSYLRKYVLALKYGGKLLKEQVTELVDECCKEDSTLSVISKWKCVQETVSKRQQWLVCKHGCQKENKKIVEIEGLQVLEYGESCTFIQLVSKVLIQSMREIQQNVSDFKNNKACKKSKERDLRDFMADIASKYKLYQEQCIDVWINELIDLLDMIQKVQSNHKTVYERILHDVYEELSLSLNDETLKLNEDLAILRRNYQQYQVETMTTLALKHRLPESQNTIRNVCNEFEKTSGLLCQNIQKLVDNYVINVQQLLEDYKQKVVQHKTTIASVSEEMSAKLQKNLVERIEMELIYLSQFYSLPLSFNECVFPHMTSLKETNEATHNRDNCPPQVVKAVENLVTATEAYWSRIMQDEAYSASLVSMSLVQATEAAIKGAEVLVHNKTCEVQHLYEQYRSMAEELRTKWRSTLENIQQLHLPT